MFHLSWVPKFEITAEHFLIKNYKDIWAESALLGANDIWVGRIGCICGLKMVRNLKEYFCINIKTDKMNRFQIAAISLLMLSVVSRDKNETEVQTDILGKWKAIEFMSIESMAYSKKDGYNPEIEFNGDGTYNLKLDMNGCIGNFTLSDNSGISITAPGCTKMCCDSEFSKKFVQMLPRVELYQFEGANLKLDVPGWGWINLELND